MCEVGVTRRTKSARIGRIFVYNWMMDSNRGIWMLFRVRENNQELSGRVDKPA